MYYIIYKTTCHVNNKIYIGQHKSETLTDSYLGSGALLKYDIKLFGKDKFQRENLFVFETFEEMDKMETSLVDLDFVARDDTYNCRTGGFNINQESDMNPTKAGKLGAKIFKEKLKDPEYYVEWYEKVKISNSQLNKRLEQSKNLKRYIKNNGSWWTGRKHTDESKKKIGDANAKHQKGKTNSNYGNCWIYNENLKENKLVKKNKLNEWLKDGWKKGRKQKEFKD